MPTESEAYILISIGTSPRKHAVYVIPCSREKAERMREEATKP